jgi:hypothetical protein
LRKISVELERIEQLVMEQLVMEQEGWSKEDDESGE